MRAMTKVADDLKLELEQIPLLEQRLKTKDKELEDLEDHVDSLKEQVLAHKFRLVPRDNDLQSGSNGMEQDMIKMALQTRQMSAEVNQLRRKLDDEIFKNSSKYQLDVYSNALIPFRVEESVQEVQRNWEGYRA